MAGIHDDLTIPCNLPDTRHVAQIPGVVNRDDGVPHARIGMKPFQADIPVRPHICIDGSRSRDDNRVGRPAKRDGWDGDTLASQPTGPHSQVDRRGA